MPVVELQIAEPAHGSQHTSRAIRLRGDLLSSGHPTLFFKWYSSLVPPPSSSTDAAILAPAGSDPKNFVPAAGLPLGSQVITFTAKDVAGDSRPELESVQHAGMAGGPAAPNSPSPCVIHVFIANMRQPSPGQTLSKASSVLSAQAPRIWSDLEYQQINQLQYRWRFTPLGPPDGRTSGELLPALSQLTPGTVGGIPVVRYQGPLPAALDTGNYQLTLRVESTVNPAEVGHEDSRSVVLAP